MASRYNKTLAAAGMAVVSALIASFSSTPTGGATVWTNVAVAVATVVSVFTAPNVVSSPATKSLLATVSTVLTGAVTVLAAHHIGAGSWLQVGVAAVGALAVYVVPNASRPTLPAAPPAPAGPAIP
jgi:hypothetical protein